MKRHAVAAAFLSAFTGAAFAQNPGNAPEQNKCEPKPTYPGLKTLKSDVEVKAFEGQIKAYKECIMGYISERRAAAKTNENAANAAADEHNKVMDKIRSDQQAQRAESDAKEAAGKK